MATPEEPTRDAVARMWRGVLDGTISRDAAHEWAAPWVEGELLVEDVMTDSALQHLHGFDMVWVDEARTIVQHGGAGTPVHSLAHIEITLETWRTNCDSPSTSSKPNGC
ncbi:hypothetical protein [Actinokineospora diospyrosa]|uniref:SnoaL-like protein n=1 Tax=Actinokineospora diospyrosa TaxID=103728 RepID=A0ABT1ICD9_9PSEU|nr:hypothetical protein [Actinokineospora diospyrosa]MCP2270229.1 hypothetical protein [Actinokineospora diospyrosa]